MVAHHLAQCNHGNLLCKSHTKTMMEVWGPLLIHKTLEGFVHSQWLWRRVAEKDFSRRVRVVDQGDQVFRLDEFDARPVCVMGYRSRS
jgi:hypothetical protein